ncbi:UDP-glucose 4-epimerase [Platysternon megacephalum]|uniref:Prolyl endopeptidase n=1 Tax=Platysternon megacephalum TaxID=55544 RepID=A0A4D9DBK6_9SAUR|nr:UDP-glucose 4-epimerase [Platysternon megacephalum]
MTGEVWLVPTTDPQAEPVCVSPRQEGLAYSVEVAGDQLLILHDRNCVDFELSRVSVDALDSPWTTVIAGVEGVRLAHVAAYASHVVVALRRDGVTGVHVMKRTPDGFEAGRDVEFDGEFYTVWPRFEADYETVENRVLYTSLVTPMTTLLLNLDSLETTVLKQTKVLEDPLQGAYDPSQYVQRREWATAADGTKIPISLFHHKEMVLDGSNPCLLYGYGSYESTSDPAFSLRKLACVERGMVFAIAHVRGGGDMGRRWYNEGKTLHKKNTFSDFVACAQHLIDVGYTQPGRLAAEGRSAGGLLMGAIANLAPELFRAVHAGVAFVDPLTSITMPELPLTIGEWEEWGDPYHDPQVYAYMKEYAPYENIDASRPYPAILATTSLNDTRVLYVEPAKWIARLRHELPDDGRDRLLHIEMVAGHGGVSGRYGAWKQDAYELAWLLTEVAS